MNYGFHSPTQQKNLAWILPRPKPDHYKGGMPLYCEEWLLDLAREILEAPDIDVLNLFCGMNKCGYRVDIKSDVNPDLMADAHKVASLIDKKFDVVLADPPYSDEESQELYQTPKLNYKKWTEQATKLLKNKGLLIVYHKYLMPNPDPKVYSVSKRVFVGSRTYHLPRVAIYFRKRK